MATYKIIDDMKIKQREGVVVSYLDKTPDYAGMSMKLVCEGQVYHYNVLMDSPKAIVIDSPKSFVGKIIEFLPEVFPRQVAY